MTRQISYQEKGAKVVQPRVCRVKYGRYGAKAYKCTVFRTFPPFEGRNPARKAKQVETP
jgi:hypothetical protein